MLPGDIFGPQVGRGRVGDGPKVFPGCDAASAVPGGAPLAIRFFSLHITPPVRGGVGVKIGHIYGTVLNRLINILGSCPVK